jgi:hypothetical protein
LEEFLEVLPSLLRIVLDPTHDGVVHSSFIGDSKMIKRDKTEYMVVRQLFELSAKYQLRKIALDHSEGFFVQLSTVVSICKSVHSQTIADSELSQKMLGTCFLQTDHLQHLCHWNYILYKIRINDELGRIKIMKNTLHNVSIANGIKVN